MKTPFQTITPTNEDLFKRLAGGGYKLMHMSGTSLYPMSENLDALNKGLDQTITEIWGPELKACFRFRGERFVFAVVIGKIDAGFANVFVCRLFVLPETPTFAATVSKPVSGSSAGR